MHGLSLAQLAERVGLPRSTVHRIVAALTAEGLMATVSPTGRVGIGPEVARLAGAGAAEFWRPVEPFMRWLHDQVGETVDCGMVDGTRVLVIHVIPTSNYVLRAIVDVGQTFPLYSTAKGRALLAAMDRPAALRLLPPELHAHTPYTVTEVAALEAGLDRAAESGITYSDEENTLGVCSAAITIRQSSGTLLAISVVVPAERYRGAEGGITAALRKIRRDMLAALALPGGTGGGGRFGECP